MLYINIKFKKKMQKKKYLTTPLRRVYNPTIVTILAKSEIQSVFCILPDEIKIFKKSTVQKVLRTLI